MASCVDCGAPCDRRAARCQRCYLGITTPAEERFWRFVVWNGDEDECMIWEGARSAGYGKFNAGPGVGVVLAHVFAYRTFIGPVPAGLELDHTCHNIDLMCAGGPPCLHRPCVNWAHLEAVTQSVNATRGRTGEHMRRG